MRRLTAALIVTSALLNGGPPARVVSTAPSLTEILFALGLGGKVAGVTEFCRYPPEAANKPKVGTFLQPDFERILSLKPDLVLVISNPAQVTQRLRQLGLRAEEVNQDSIASVLESIRRIGDLTGAELEAARLSAALQTDLDSVRRSVAGKPRRTAIFLVGRAPGTLQGMVGAGPGTFIDELISLAGGRNALAHSPIQYPRISVEQILAADPEFILDMGDFAHAQGRPGQPEPEILALWSKYPQLKAVRNRNVRVIDSETFIRPGPRMTEAARRLRDVLHPESPPR